MDEHTAKTPINSGTRNIKLVYDAPSFSLGLTQEDLVTIVSNPLQLTKSEEAVCSASTVVQIRYDLEVKGSSSSGIMICANGTSLSFTPMEFASITGLNYVSNRYDFIFYEDVPNRMIKKYFNGAEIIQKKQLYLAFMEKVWGENNDKDAEKFAILYFLHSFVLSNIDTVVIPYLHFDLVDSGRYKDFLWGSLSFEDLAKSLNNRLKAKGKFYLIQGMPLAIQVWLYECCLNVPPKIALKVENRISRLLNWKTITPRPRYKFLMNAMFKDNGKVVFKNIEPTEMELAKLEIPQKDVTEDKRSVDSDDDFQDPPPKKINERSKKKQKVDLSTPVAKKPSGKKQVSSFDVHTQTRTPPHRAAKAVVMKTPVFNSIPTRQASSSKMKEGKQTARVIFSQITDKKLDDTNLSDLQFTIPDSCYQVLMHTEEKASRDIHWQLLKKDKSMNILMIKSSNLLFKIIVSSKADMHGEVDLGTEEQIMTTPKIQELTTDEQRDETVLPDSQDTIPDDLLPSLNVYSSKSIIVHPSTNRELQTPIPKLMIRRPSKFKESPYTMKFGSASEKYN
ncbi:hypothetical protein FXO37_17956 [Capsicum annuum]|nr:hypothetical protein FXO37_17956 [Capsicum annuum]